MTQNQSLAAPISAPWRTGDVAASLPCPNHGTEFDEVALVSRLRRSDEEAFETIVRIYSGRLLSVARRILNNEEDARDAVQDAFLSMVRSIHGFEANSRLGTWLHRIVVNASLMKLRTRRRKPEEPIEDLLPTFKEDGHQSTPFSDDGDTPEKLLERRETRAAVRACINRLPESYRIVLMLRDIEELDTEETARVLQVSTNAVKIRLHRARQALLTLLTQAPNPV